ncbi:uncharacterized protein BDR25DRAFT_316138 [Lindgomyces ingoldianus]|uniref:Uncharacterized protein n=1 Tax=Lindgomyces ingoldianus TaxID=673940 RepID=A0ACB6QQH2_9PLEO|nr:uncharacterized protein BDR25DRAFT_316138 [Lindgomyces ingoldianus]KAF2468350.1 hypothetical protein BDR25DRAFT_316138 [Lindgomyces ingoldianus]
MAPGGFMMTYKYRPLESHRHIRLLQVLSTGDNERIQAEARPPTYRYRIIHRELSNRDAQLEFKAVSYTWGSPNRVAGLTIDENVKEEKKAKAKAKAGAIGLTENLSQALPRLCQHSITKLLWIDQLCINQIDLAEK